MSKKGTYRIKSILHGMSPSAYFGRDGQFLSSLGVDPEDAVGSGPFPKPSGAIVPVRYENFASSALLAAPMWLFTSPKTTVLYAYMKDGKFASYANTLLASTHTALGTPTNGAGNGAVYYDNYAYLMTPTDVSRYGPLDGSASLTNNYWTSTLSKTALTDTLYGGFNATHSNHAGHVHQGKLYFLDFINGRGKAHFIQTTRTTAEGDTDNGSTYGAFTFPEGYYPFDLESYGSDIIFLVSSNPGVNASAIEQGKAALLFWDTFSSTAYRKIDLPDQIATAILTHKGTPYFWHGGIGTRGYTLSRYIGGNQIEPVESFNQGGVPFAGAVDSIGNRIVWGSNGIYPTNWSGILARGYKNPNLPSAAINNIGVISGSPADSNTVVTALKYIQASQTNNFKPVMGWSVNDPSSVGLDKVSSTATFKSKFYNEIITVGKRFQITRVRIPLASAVAANMTITPTIYLDNESSSEALTVINSTNYSASDRMIVEDVSINGENNFFLGFAFTGTASCPVTFPIEFEVEIFND